MSELGFNPALDSSHWNDKDEISRDKSIKIWKEISATSFEMDKTLVGHTDFVSSLAWMPPGLQQEFPAGALVSGSRDTNIIVWDHDNEVVAQTLKGHEYQVSSIGILEDGAIVSASLDKSLKVWKGDKAVTVLNGHEAAVLCVLVLPDNHILSGSGDKTLKVWAKGQLVNTLSGHADTVRGLALLPGVGVVSASHDQTLRLWTLDSNCVGQMVGHTAIVYCCATSENGLIASGSEDNTARVWRADGTLVATIMHPGCVWAVAFLPNEDLVTGCADGIVRVWSTSDERKASAEDIAALEASVAAMQEELLASQKGSLPPGLNIEDPSVLLSPGVKDGANKIVKEGGGAVVYSWSAEKGEWEKVGDVMGDGGGEMTVPSKTYHKGREWDYAFDVDVEDGHPMLKLCMNAGDNPYLVAERFMIENNLPNSYLDQIIQFIMAKTEHLPVVNVDPLTGGQSYVPRDDPSGPSIPLEDFPLTGGGWDPLTGSGYSTSKHYHFSPKTSYVFFDMLRPAPPMVAKIQGFSAELSSDTASVSLTEQEISGGLETLLNGALRSAKGEISSLEDQDYVLLQKLMKFPHHQLFPVLDVCRMMALDVITQGRLAAMAGDLLSEKPGILGSCILNSDTASGHGANQQMALQFLANCFKHPNLKAWVLNNRFIILEKFRGCCEASMKNTRHALSTLVLNIAVEAHVGGDTPQEGKEQALEVVAQILTTIPGDDHETVFRTLVAAGTLMHDDSKLKMFAKHQGLLDLAQQRFQDPAAPTKLKQAIDDLKAILQ